MEDKPKQQATTLVLDAGAARPASRNELGTTFPEEGLKSRDETLIDSPSVQVDPRIHLNSRPSSEQLDESFIRQLRDVVHHREHRHPDLSPLEKVAPSEIEEIIYVEFEDTDDKRDPANFSRTRKWAITLVACMFTSLSAAAASSYNLGFEKMTRDLNCTEFQATMGLSFYALGFGVVPLFTASLSEEFGRQPLYVVSCFGFMMMHLMVALSDNIQTVLIARFLGGAFGSTGSTMVGGSVADIWRPSERGLPMAIYSVTALGGTGIGPIAAGWIAANRHLGWRWIQWIHVMCATGVLLVGICLIMTETRTSVILTRLARKLRKETGDKRYRARAEDESASLKTLIYISSTRPIYLLTSEPIVAAFSLWVGFAWGVLYCLIEYVYHSVFRDIYGFNNGETGTIFATLLIGTAIGFLSNMHQERVYHIPKTWAGARLYWVCPAGVMFPAGMFIYAWTAYSSVTWVAPAIAVVIVIWAIYLIYLAVFTYLADCYGPFASSALAGQSLCRNLMGMAFPLFTQQMIAKLNVHWANTLFACIAVLMAPIPLILFLYGPKIRARSKFSRQVTHT